MNKLSWQPWVFWFNISIRKHWFKRFWKTRGANFMELQIWIFKVNIGMPWLSNVVYRHRKDYGSNNYIRTTNADNLKQKWSVPIGKQNNNHANRQQRNN